MAVSGNRASISRNFSNIAKPSLFAPDLFRPPQGHADSGRRARAHRGRGGIRAAAGARLRPRLASGRADRMERGLLDDGADPATARLATVLGQAIEARKQTPLLALDFTFRPQAFVIVLWALGDARRRRTIERATAKALRWLEDEVAETRWSSSRGRAKKKTSRPLKRLLPWWRASSLSKFGKHIVDGLVQRCRPPVRPCRPGCICTSTPHSPPSTSPRSSPPSAADSPAATSWPTPVGTSWRPLAAWNRVVWTRTWQVVPRPTATARPPFPGVRSSDPGMPPSSSTPPTSPTCSLRHSASSWKWHIGFTGRPSSGGPVILLALLVPALMMALLLPWTPSRTTFFRVRQRQMT